MVSVEMFNLEILNAKLWDRQSLLHNFKKKNRRKWVCLIRSEVTKWKKKSTQNPPPLSACGMLGTELNY